MLSYGLCLVSQILTIYVMEVILLSIFLLPCCVYLWNFYILVSFVLMMCCCQGSKPPIDQFVFLSRKRVVNLNTPIKMEMTKTIFFPQKSNFCLISVSKFFEGTEMRSFYFEVLNALKTKCMMKSKIQSSFLYNWTLKLKRLYLQKGGTFYFNFSAPQNQKLWDQQQHLSWDRWDQKNRKVIEERSEDASKRE